MSEFGNNPNIDIDDGEEEMPVEETKTPPPKPKQKTSFNYKKDDLHAIEQINFALVSLETSIDELKKLSNLQKLVESIKNLEDFKVDTSKIDEKIEEVAKNMNNKIESLNDKIDLHELDEISLKLNKLNKKFRGCSFLNWILVVVLSSVLFFTNSEKIMNTFSNSTQNQNKQTVVNYIIPRGSTIYSDSTGKELRLIDGHKIAKKDIVEIGDPWVIFTHNGNKYMVAKTIIKKEIK